MMQLAWLPYHAAPKLRVTYLTVSKSARKDKPCAFPKVFLITYLHRFCQPNFHLSDITKEFRITCQTSTSLLADGHLQESKFLFPLFHDLMKAIFILVCRGLHIALGQALLGKSLWPPARNGSSLTMLKLLSLRHPPQLLSSAKMACTKSHMLVAPRRG